jgi:hypothetical protein
LITVVIVTIVIVVVVVVVLVKVFIIVGHRTLCGKNLRKGRAGAGG